MKIRARLLNDGGYGNGTGIKFPVEVEALTVGFGLISVSGAELKRVGFDNEFEDENLYVFDLDNGEAEVL